ncbi:MAG TPA: hypothetical protein ENL03_03045 [Phycisphaerae bacterium]|nr:hypothetical protein [Phycisphaerae bacterium]
MTFNEIRERLAKVGEPDWVHEMKDYFARTGTYPPEHLRKLLGDPNKGVEMGSRESIAKNFASGGGL